MEKWDKFIQKGNPTKYFVPAGISNRHVHLCEADLVKLFGEDCQLSKRNDLSQPGQYACQEQIIIAGPKGSIERVRILGPTRKETQVEVSATDTFQLGIKPCVRLSGDLAGSPGGKLIGPKGEVTLEQGFIVAARHLHMSTEEAGLFGLKNGDIIQMVKKGARETVYGNVIVRAGVGHAMELHLDTEEGNAAGMEQGELVEICK
jgi:putative phosphotransacetylase